jgi:hypothetical protein
MYIKKRKPGYQPKENKIIEQIDFSSMDDILMNCFALVHSLKDKKNHDWRVPQPCPPKLA